MNTSPILLPYYAVVFTSTRTNTDDEGYAATAARMEELAKVQPGFLGIDTARSDDGTGITISYWDSLDAIRNWRENAEHRLAQENGKAKWYARYRLRICRVEADYGSEKAT